MDLQALTEQDIRTKYITPALVETAGWDRERQLREEVYLTAGRIYVRGRLTGRAKGKKADYVLYYKPNIPLAIVEAKDANHGIGDGMQQALEYAEIMDVPFVYSSNGRGFLEHDRTGSGGPVERELPLDGFPGPEELWARYRAARGLTPAQEKVVLQDYFRDSVEKAPRYYQLVAVNRIIERIARGQDRILLVMATGCGKTFTAFQIIWRLWKAGLKKRILFLADRNVLVDQTKTNDFKPFGNKMTKVQGHRTDKSYEIYLSLYQAITGPEEDQKAFRNFSRDFFDLIVVDECHRGSAAEDSAWREILEYFDSATQIGMTATPKETKYVSNIDYFGEPVYTYSLKQGIEDGFLAPYKVIRITMDRDDGWRPDSGQVDRYGEEIPDEVYNYKDFDRKIVLSERTKQVAGRITAFLQEDDPFAKTIVFCENIEHAEHMRQALVNASPELAADNPRYVVRITGDNQVGKAELDNFIMPSERYPVIAVTSRLMSTGVDAKTCKLIAIDRTINSMTEFKQIIGRGTRIDEDYGKRYFTIMDFRRVTNLFADPDFDGEPVSIYEGPVPANDGGAIPGDMEEQEVQSEEAQDFPDDIEWEADEAPIDAELGRDVSAGPRRYYVDDVEVTVVNEWVQYLDGEGKLITESLRDYSKRLLQEEYRDLDSFLTTWTKAERKQAIIQELEEQGILLGELQKEVGAEYDAFDLICHVAFDRPALTRSERARKVKQSDYFSKYDEQARKVLEALLDKYANEGVANIEDARVLANPPFSQLGTVMELIQSFGDKAAFDKAVQELEAILYSAA